MANKSGGQTQFPSLYTLDLLSPDRAGGKKRIIFSANVMCKVILPLKLK